MGFRMRKSIKICKGVKLNVSKSGISTSVKVGNVTYNTKRGTTVNLGNGLSYHSSNKKHTIENKWDKMTDKQIKNYNVLMKILLGMLSILSLILTLAIPPAIIVSVVSGIIAYKFDAKKMQSKCKNNEVTQDILVDNEEMEEIDTNSLNSGILLATETEEQVKANYEIIQDDYILRKYSKVYSISYTQKFNDIDIEGYKILNKDMNVVGGWYRKENVNEFFDAIKNIQMQ